MRGKITIVSPNPSKQWIKVSTCFRIFSFSDSAWICLSNWSDRIGERKRRSGTIVGSAKASLIGRKSLTVSGLTISFLEKTLRSPAVTLSPNVRFSFSSQLVEYPVLSATTRARIVRTQSLLQDASFFPWLQTVLAINCISIVKIQVFFINNHLFPLLIMSRLIDIDTISECIRIAFVAG